MFSYIPWILTWLHDLPLGLHYFEPSCIHSNLVVLNIYLASMNSQPAAWILGFSSMNNGLNPWISSWLHEFRLSCINVALAVWYLTFLHEFCFGCKLDVCVVERQVCSQGFIRGLTRDSGCKVDALAAAANLTFLAAAAKLMAAAANLTPISTTPGCKWLWIFVLSRGAYEKQMA